MSDFYGVDALIAKCQKLYDRGDIFISYITGEEYFPFSINLRITRQKDIQERYEHILNGIKKLENLSFCLEYEQKSFKTLGKQKVPVKINFQHINDFLKLVKKEKEYEEFIHVYEKIKSKYPSLKELFIKKPFLIHEYKKVWNELLVICEYLLKNPSPNIYIRELSFKNIDTKFVEKHTKIIDILVSHVKNENSLNSLKEYAFEKKYGFRFPQVQVRFRILDSKLFISGLRDISLTLSEFKTLNLPCKKIFIVENQITTLSFLDVKDSIVIFGQGYKVSILKDIEWFLDKQIYYWGDIDLDGFAILSQLKQHYKHAKSILMNTKTLEDFLHVKVEAKTKNKEKTLPNLNKDEQLVYDRLANEYYGKNLRIEQEKIPFSYVRDKININGAIGGI